MAFYIYVLHCANGTFYTGITNNLSKRLFEHKNGLSSFTKGRLPVHLVYYEITDNRNTARQREIVIKDMSQKKKQMLINKFTSSISEKRR